MTFLLTYWRWIALAALLAAAAAFGAWRMHAHDQITLDALRADYEQFKGGVAALGRAAQERTKATELANQKRKQDADESNKSVTIKLRADIERLRLDRDRARGGFVPVPAPGAGSPDLACFDRAELESAIGRLVGQLRGLTQEGDQAIIDLNTAKGWASAK